MNTEDDEFERIEREATRGVPDAIHHTDTSESLEYITGWNDCRQAMLAEQPAPMSQPNRVISYAAAMKLRELGYEWMNDEWKHLDELAEQPAQQEPVGRVCFEGDEVVWSDEPPESGTLLYTTPQAPKEKS